MQSRGTHGPDIRVSSMRPLGPVVIAAAKATLVGAIIALAAPPAGLLAAETSSPPARSSQRGSRHEAPVSLRPFASPAFWSRARRPSSRSTLPGLRVTEVLVGEGDRVTAGQTLVRLARQAGEGQDAAAAGRSTHDLEISCRRGRDAKHRRCGSHGVPDATSRCSGSRSTTRLSSRPKSRAYMQGRSLPDKPCAS